MASLRTLAVSSAVAPFPQRTLAAAGTHARDDSTPAGSDATGIPARQVQGISDNGRAGGALNRAYLA